MTVPSPRQSVLTVSEARRVVVDVAQVDGDGSGASQPPLVAPHVSGLEHDVVLVLRLPVHLGHSGADDTCGATRGGGMRGTAAQGREKPLSPPLALILPKHFEYPTSASSGGGQSLIHLCQFYQLEQISTCLHASEAALAAAC